MDQVDGIVIGDSHADHLELIGVSVIPKCWLLSTAWAGNAGKFYDSPNAKVPLVQVVSELSTVPTMLLDRRKEIVRFWALQEQNGDGGLANRQIAEIFGVVKGQERWSLHEDFTTYP